MARHALHSLACAALRRDLRYDATPRHIDTMRPRVFCEGGDSTEVGLRTGGVPCTPRLIHLRAEPAASVEHARASASADRLRRNRCAGAVTESRCHPPGKQRGQKSRSEQPRRRTNCKPRLASAPGSCGRPACATKTLRWSRRQPSNANAPSPWYSAPTRTRDTRWRSCVGVKETRTPSLLRCTPLKNEPSSWPHR